MKTLGSSPLARGLLGHISSIPMHARIIPARAGFTPEPMVCWNVYRDHPRSRGVYAT